MSCAAQILYCCAGSAGPSKAIQGTKVCHSTGVSLPLGCIAVNAVFSNCFLFQFARRHKPERTVQAICPTTRPEDDENRKHRYKFYDSYSKQVQLASGHRDCKEVPKCGRRLIRHVYPSGVYVALVYDSRSRDRAAHAGKRSRGPPGRPGRKRPGNWVAGLGPERGPGQRPWVLS